LSVSLSEALIAALTCSLLAGCVHGGGENAGVENAGVENAGVDSRGGKCRSGKCRSDNLWKAVRIEKL